VLALGVGVALAPALADGLGVADEAVLTDEVVLGAGRDVPAEAAHPLTRAHEAHRARGRTSGRIT
jgi:hypothetical protein